MVDWVKKRAQQAKIDAGFAKYDAEQRSKNLARTKSIAESRGDTATVSNISRIQSKQSSSSGSSVEKLMGEDVMISIGAPSSSINTKESPITFYTGQESKSATEQMTSTRAPITPSEPNMYSDPENPYSENYVPPNKRQSVQPSKPRPPNPYKDSKQAEYYDPENPYSPFYKFSVAPIPVPSSEVKVTKRDSEKRAKEITVTSGGISTVYSANAENTSAPESYYKESAIKEFEKNLNVQYTDDYLKSVAGYENQSKDIWKMNEAERKRVATYNQMMTDYETKRDKLERDYKRGANYGNDFMSSLKSGNFRPALIYKEPKWLGDIKRKRQYEKAQKDLYDTTMRETTEFWVGKPYSEISASIKSPQIFQQQDYDIQAGLRYTMGGDEGLLYSSASSDRVGSIKQDKKELVDRKLKEYERKEGIEIKSLYSKEGLEGLNILEIAAAGGRYDPENKKSVFISPVYDKLEMVFKSDDREAHEMGHYMSVGKGGFKGYYDDSLTSKEEFADNFERFIRKPEKFSKQEPELAALFMQELGISEFEFFGKESNKQDYGKAPPSVYAELPMANDFNAGGIDLFREIYAEDRGFIAGNLAGSNIKGINILQYFDTGGKVTRKNVDEAEAVLGSTNFIGNQNFLESTSATPTRLDEYAKARVFQGEILKERVKESAKPILSYAAGLGISAGLGIGLSYSSIKLLPFIKGLETTGGTVGTTMVSAALGIGEVGLIGVDAYWKATVLKRGAERAKSTYETGFTYDNIFGAGELIGEVAGVYTGIKATEAWNKNYLSKNPPILSDIRMSNVRAINLEETFVKNVADVSAKAEIFGIEYGIFGEEIPTTWDMALPPTGSKRLFRGKSEFSYGIYEAGKPASKKTITSQGDEFITIIPASKGRYIDRVTGEASEFRVIDLNQKSSNALGKIEGGGESAYYSQTVNLLETKPLTKTSIKTDVSTEYGLYKYDGLEQPLQIFEMLTGEPSKVITDTDVYYEGFQKIGSVQSYETILDLGKTIKGSKNPFVKNLYNKMEASYDFFIDAYNNLLGSFNKAPELNKGGMGEITSIWLDSFGTFTPSEVSGKDIFIEPSTAPKTTTTKKSTSSDSEWTSTSFGGSRPSIKTIQEGESNILSIGAGNPLSIEAQLSFVANEIGFGNMKTVTTSIPQINVKKSDSNGKSPSLPRLSILPAIQSKYSYDNKNKRQPPSLMSSETFSSGGFIDIGIQGKASTNIFKEDQRTSQQLRQGMVSKLSIDTQFKQEQFKIPSLIEETIPNPVSIYFPHEPPPPPPPLEDPLPPIITPIFGFDFGLGSIKSSKKSAKKGKLPKPIYRPSLIGVATGTKASRSAKKGGMLTGFEIRGI